MDLKLVVPFRIPFELPRDAILAKHDRWVQMIREVAPRLEDNTELPNASLGNYAWSKLLDLREQKDQMYGGKGGLNDPGWFFRSHYMMALHSSALTAEVYQGNNSDWCKVFDDQFKWECQLIDNTVAVLVIELAVRDITNFCQRVNVDLQAFYDFTNDLAAEFIQLQKSNCSKALKWINDNLFVPVGVEGIDCNDRFLDEKPPIYRDCYIPFWNHRAFRFSDEERNSLGKDEKEALAQILSEELQKTWMENGGYGYGWGATAIVEKAQYDRQWLDALIISQYYYACLDLIDTTLPVSISVLRLQSQEGHHKRVLDYARKTYSKINTLINDYNNMMLRTASEAYRGVKAYYDNWRMEKLVDNVKDKLELYRELIEISSDKINKSTQSFIENFLFGITLLSLVGLFASLHDYLAGAYDPRDPEALPSLAMNYGKDDLLITSVFIMLLFFVVYMWLIRRRR